MLIEDKEKIYDLAIRYYYLLLENGSTVDDAALALKGLGLMQDEWHDMWKYHFGDSATILKPYAKCFDKSGTGQ